VRDLGNTVLNHFCHGLTGERARLTSPIRSPP
jgi:hypothetical protein